MTVTNKKPNFLIIIADDLGFTDLGAYGGEIDTPNLDKLARNGIRFTDFHTASACSPTRSMLFSGTDNHIAGVGQMVEYSRNYPEIFKDKPGYEGYLNDRVAPLPELLKERGDYYTFISGKWHLGLLEEYWPVNRGFEKAFTLLPGAGNHFKYFPKDDNGKDINFLSPLYAEDNKSLNPDEDIPVDFYSTNFYTDKALDYLDEKYRKGRPFFGCLTYTAPHWPLQAFEEVVAKYKGKYDDGPEELRKRRLAQAAKLGIIPEGIEPHPLTTFNKRWSELTEEERKVSSRIMEVYSAMVDILDKNVGKLVNKLEENGELDNTFILFMSDNGAEGMLMEALPLVSERINHYVKKHFNNSLENIGKKDSFTFYGDQWAQAATSPWSMYKTYNSEGGIRCPLILHYPRLINNDNRVGKILDGFTTVMDITPTVLELANVKHPGSDYKGRNVAVPRGKSWARYILGEREHVHDEQTVTGWELFGQQAIRKGDYKLLYVPPPVGDDKWLLYNIKKDPGEVHDIADEEPAKLNELLDHWAEYVAETGLIEINKDFYKASFKEDDNYQIDFKIIQD